MTIWISDENGNRASVEFYGSDAAARAALATNKDCRNCDNCFNCFNCSGCFNCSRCSRCSGCSDCSRCSGCSDCSDCSRCSGCSDCSDCSRCSGCSDCFNCFNCSDCSGCSGCSGCMNVRDVVNPIVVGPTRSDGYQFVMGASRSIHAGCRVMVSLAEARTHWENTRGGTALGRETMLILDQLEALAAIRQEGRAS